MINWNIVEAIYILDILIFGYLFYYFLSALRGSSKEAKPVVRMMVILTGILFVQELYFGINTLTDPNKLGYASQLFPAVNSLWIYAKILLTIAGATIIYTISQLKK